MLGSPAGPGAPSQRGLWTSAPISSATGFTADGFSKYGVYSLFPGGPTFGSALYSHANAFGRFTSGQFQPTPGNIFHGSHKVSDSLFSSTGYTFGAPTPPPGSPYSPIPVAQLELLTKGINSNIIIQQSSDFSLSPKKVQITEKRCDERCCNVKQKLCPYEDESSATLKGRFTDSGSGCSRTNPIEWGNVNVKKEPGHPCQVAEITTSIPPVIKVEVASPTQKNVEKDVSPIINSASGNIPVGIAVARQRIQQPELINSPSLPPAGLLTTVNAAGQIKEIARLSEIESTQAGMAASVTAGGATGGTILQCPDDRSNALANWPIGGAQSSSLTTPTLWQYPAPVPMESMVPLPVPMPPVGFQLVRDPSSGGFLLLPTTTNLEPIHQTVVWPSYSQPSPLLLPPIPPPPLQLLSSATSDYLSSSSTFQQTQTHSTRLVAVTTDTKRKLPLPSTTLIKIEADASSLDQSKTISTMSSSAGTVFSDQSIAPLVTTHVIYQHPPNLILSQSSTIDTSCKSQVTSPVPCLTPPPEISSQSEEPPLAVDASNQTDTPICSEDDNTLQTLPEVNTESTTTIDLESTLKVDTLEQPHSEIETINHHDENTTIEQCQENLDSQETTEVNEEKEDNIESAEVSMPDLSGLELLSNSIVEFESCRNKIKSEGCTNEEKKVEEPKSSYLEVAEIIQHADQKEKEDTLGGLDLLCALAEQRILEESSEMIVPKVKDKLSRKEKRKARRHSEESKQKKHKSDKYSDEGIRFRLDLGLEKSLVSKRSASEENSGDIEGDIKCTCRIEKYKTYHTPQSQEEVRKFIASKSQSTCCQAEWPYMNAMELDMRMRLADLQRQYREKQKELSKLSSRKRHHHRHHHHSDCSKKRSRKKSSHSERSDRSDTPPPRLDPVEVIQNSMQTTKHELLKPPTLCAIENIKINKHSGSKKSKLIEMDNFKAEEPYVDETRWPIKRKSTESRRNSHEKERKSSSKKRKVGRPKKISERYTPTETIVAKKPKAGSFVGYLMAAKEKLQMRRSFSDSPPRFIDDSTSYMESKNNNNIIEESHPNTEATNELYDDDEVDWETEGETEVKTAEYEEHLNEEEEEEAIQVKTEVLEEEETVEEDVTPHVCTLTPSHLEMENLRVLTAMGGLFYAGQLHAVQPPDVYSITLDGERGNRPHIMSREEILRDAIVELAPKSTEELETGTRLCAYWSQQYRCLYPGSVAEPGTPNPELDSKFVAVEFDDGDSGTIALEDIRLLPANYPVMEYDPNPLLSLSKRKRRTSSSATTGIERRQSQLSHHEEPKPPTPSPVIKVEPKIEGESHKERKRLKKKKKEKIKLKQKAIEKKKKRKHRCGEEKCKHKKHHKKHRKHKKHHHDKEESSTTLDEKSESDKSTLMLEEEEYTSEDNQVILQESIDVDEETNGSTDDVVDNDDDDDYTPNPEDEVTMDDILEVVPKTKKIRDRQASCESSKSKMSAFLPARQLWSWSGKGYKRPRSKGRGRKEFYRSIQRGKELISVGDSAVFLSTGRPDRPYIGRIEAMWEQCSTMVVRVKWFYHPEETVGCPENLKYPGALFESPHVDENDVQTISHKCEVLSLDQYIATLGNDPQRFATIYENNDIYYLAGHYDPISTSLTMEEGIPCGKFD
ncbi:hypothetical protein HHI36_015987 [Cryptolaemus montrouzieri]|uniref:BAH domain-containing protein n=1 Tax=Cryptolaemus montrouzieri TaxID=559131 RepID=A0ABD2N723_9CUCU